MDLQTDYQGITDILIDSDSRVGPYVKKFLKSGSEQLNRQLSEIQDVFKRCLDNPDPLAQAQSLSSTWPILVGLSQSAANYVSSLRQLISHGIPTNSGYSEESNNVDLLPLEKILSRALIRPSSTEFPAGMTIAPQIKEILLDQASLLQQYVDSDLLNPYFKKSAPKPNKGEAGQENEGKEDEEEDENENEDEDEDEGNEEYRLWAAKLADLSDRDSETLITLENRLINFNRTCVDYIRYVSENIEYEQGEAERDTEELCFRSSEMPSAENNALLEDKIELQRYIEMMFTGNMLN